MKKVMKKCSLYKSNKGSSSVVIICTSLIIAIVAAIITDVGYATYQQYKMFKDSDKVLKNGRKELIKGREYSEKYIRTNVIKKNSDLNRLEVMVSNNNKEITIILGKPFEYLFLKYVGLNAKQIMSSTTAILSNVGSFKGIRPFAVENNKFLFDSEYVLINKANDQKVSDSNFINYVPLDLDGGSFNINVVYGYRKDLQTDDVIYSLLKDSTKDSKDGIEYLLKKCQHKPKCIYDNYFEDCSKLIVLPVVDKIDYSGSKPMTIKGFITFFIESSAVNEGSIEIRGRFIKNIITSNTADGNDDYGLQSLKIVR